MKKLNVPKGMIAITAEYDDSTQGIKKGDLIHFIPKMTREERNDWTAKELMKLSNYASNPQNLEKILNTIQHGETRQIK